MSTEKELLELIIKYKLPNIDTYQSPSYYYRLNRSFLENQDFILWFGKWENNNKQRNWKLMKVFKDVNDNIYDSYEKLVEREIRILKSIYENPNNPKLKK